MDINSHIPTDIINVLSVREMIAKNATNKDFYDELLFIENALNFVKPTIYDNPYYLVAPTSIEQRQKWIETTDGYENITSEIRKTLFDKGFVLLSRELLGEKTSGEDFLAPMCSKSNNIILDKDYGLTILPENPYKKNFYLGMSELERYGTTYPMLKGQLSNLFSIGALRAGSILNKNFAYSPLEIKVNTRSELDNYLEKLRENLIKYRSRFKIWFRGQSNEHFLPEIDSAILKHCPWRSIKDPSLSPSIFRNSDTIYNDLKSYTLKLSEILEFEISLNRHLKIPKFESRNTNEEKIKLYFKDSVWEDSNSPFSFTHANEKGEVISIHDYNPIYRALQTSLFLQHYGIPTNILDITKDLDVALFFAQNKINNGIYERLDSVDESVLYVFLLDPKTDRFIDSSELLESFAIQRPLRQKCGVIAGACFSAQNYYSRFISIRIKFNKTIDYNNDLTPEYLFPSSEEDTILDFLTQFGEKNNFVHVKPFKIN